MQNIRIKIAKKVRNFDVLNKDLNAVNITNINPATLVIKNRG